MTMKRIYSSQTGCYLGIIFARFGTWYSENRRATVMRHATEAEAMERLERQPEHQATAA